MQSTGHSSTQARSLTSMHGAPITYVTWSSSLSRPPRRRAASITRAPGARKNHSTCEKWLVARSGQSLDTAGRRFASAAADPAEHESDRDAEAQHHDEQPVGPKKEGGACGA